MKENKNNSKKNAGKLDKEALKKIAGGGLNGNYGKNDLCEVAKCLYEEDWIEEAGQYVSRENAMRGWMSC